MTTELLHLRAHRSSAEMKRCEEELGFLSSDARRAEAFTLYQANVLADLLESLLADLTQESRRRSMQIGQILIISVKLRQHLASITNVWKQCAVL